MIKDAKIYFNADITHVIMYLVNLNIIYSYLGLLKMNLNYTTWRQNKSKKH